MINSIKYPEDFFTLLQREGVSLSREGVGDVALPLNAAVQAIAILRTSRTATIGGEVWQKVGDRFKPTYDGWGFEGNICDNENINSTLNSVERLINFYASQRGEFYITFGF